MKNNNYHVQKQMRKTLTIPSKFACFLFSFLGILLSMYMHPHPSYAATQTIRVSPVIMNITLSPGKIASQEAIIENLSNTPLPLKATLNDFMTSGEEGGYDFEQKKQNPLLSWIKLSEDNYILQPHEKKKITIYIQTPSTIPVGGYYGILFFEPVKPLHQATLINSKVGIVMLANIGVPDPKAKKAEIVSFIPKQISFNGEIPFVLRVKNISLNFFSAKPSIIAIPLISIDQNEHSAQFLEEKIIFPDKIRRWTDEKTLLNLSPNIYQLKTAVSTGNGQQEINISYAVVLPSIILVIVSFNVLSILLLIFFRKRIRKAIKAFLS